LKEVIIFAIEGFGHLFGHHQNICQVLIRQICQLLPTEFRNDKLQQRRREKEKKKVFHDRQKRKRKGEMFGKRSRLQTEWPLAKGKISKVAMVR